MTALPNAITPPASLGTSAQCLMPDASRNAKRCDAIIADPYIPGLHWIPVDLAAQALSLGERAMRMKGDSLKAAGMAKQLSPTVGGQLKWHFSSRYDARLAALVSASASESAPGEADTSAACEALRRFQAAPKDRQNAAMAKATAVKVYREWRRAPTTRITSEADQDALMRTIAAHGGAVPKSMQRLWDWNNLVASLNLHTAAGFQAACWELLDRRGGNRDAGYSGEAWDVFQATYLRDNKLSIRKCWEIAGAEARRNDWTWISLSRAKQLVNERLSASVRTYARQGEERWQRDHLPTLTQDPNAWAAGQCVETDHSRCDFFCRTVRDGKIVAERPWITAFLDRRSRRLVGWSMGWTADSDSIRTALHHMLSQGDVSVPEVVVLDNGKDFASQEFSGSTKAQRRRGDDPMWSGLFALLGIAPQFATPYNHNGKARIERFFGVMHNDFDRALDSWSGSGGESGGRDQDKVDAMLADPRQLPSIEEARAKFARWIEHYNHNADRNIEALVDESGKRLSPAEWYSTRLPKFRPLANKARVLAMLEHRWSRPITPNKNGVSIKISGRTLSYGQHEPAVVDLVGSGAKVHVTFNPHDLNSVRVYDERFALLCEAPMNTRHGGPTDTPLAKKDLQTALARQRQHKRDVRRQVDIAAAVLPIADLARMEEREREVAETKARMKAEGIDNPAPMRLVSSPLSGGGTPTEDQSSAIPLRKAAGAEHDHFPTAFQRHVNATSTGLEGGDADLADLGSFSLASAQARTQASASTSRPEEAMDMVPLDDDFDLLRDLSA